MLFFIPATIESIIFVNIPPFFSFGCAAACKRYGRPAVSLKIPSGATNLFRIRAEDRHQLQICEVIIVVVIKVVEEFVSVAIVVFVAHVGNSLPNNLNLQSKPKCCESRS